jgi:enamine deaminase RidA (YjgF/YER057c/UK114 family)
MSDPAYSPSLVVSGEIVLLSGLIGNEDNEDALVASGGQSMAQELAVIMRKIDAELAKHGMTRANLGYTKVMVVDRGEFPDHDARWEAFNNLWAEAMSGVPHLPTRDFSEVVDLSCKATLKITGSAARTVNPAPAVPPKPTPQRAVRFPAPGEYTAGGSS